MPLFCLLIISGNGFNFEFLIGVLIVYFNCKTLIFYAFFFHPGPHTWSEESNTPITVSHSGDPGVHFHNILKVLYFFAY